jgi:hypothetical protein
MSYVRALADGVPSRRLSARLDGTNVTAQAKGQQARSGSRRLPERVGMFLPCSHRSWWNLASSRVGKPRHSIRRGHHVSIGNDWSLLAWLNSVITQRSIPLAESMIARLDEQDCPKTIQRRMPPRLGWRLWHGD